MFLGPVQVSARALESTDTTTTRGRKVVVQVELVPPYRSLFAYSLFEAGLLYSGVLSLPYVRAQVDEALQRLRKYFHVLRDIDVGTTVPKF